MWKSYGVTVAVSTINILQKTGCEQLLNDANKIGPVAGIFNLAVALRDGIFDNQTVELFEESLAPKATATQYLDDISRKLCPKLKHFVVASSVSCGRGNAGQSNYGMANSIMERICEKRHKLGLPAKAIQFGAIGDVGLLAALQEINMDMEISGTLPQRITSCLEALDTLLTYDNEPIVATMVVAEKHFDDAKKGNIIETIMNIMTIRDRKQISMEASLSKLGMDSLMGVEIQQILERDYDLVLSSQELRSLTLSQLEKLVTSNGSANSTLGIEKLVTSLGNEETSSEVILQLNKSLKTSLSDEKILIIPGIEGMASEVWYQIAEKISHPTYLLQLATTAEEKDVEKIIQVTSQVKLRNLINWMCLTIITYLQHVLKLYAKEKNFTLIGYSFGSLLTLKIAKLLEDNNKHGKIILIDGSPKFIHQITNHLATNQISDENLQEIILMGCIKLVFRDGAQEMVKKVFSKTSMEERLETFLKHAISRSAYSMNYARQMIKGLQNRLKIGVNCDKISFSKLKNSSMTLIKPSEMSLKNIENDYDLKNLVGIDVGIQSVEGDHSSILTNPNLVKYVNQVIEINKN